MNDQQYAILADELTNDPEGIGYAGMDDVQAQDALNLVNRTRVRASMSGDEVYTATDSAELASLTDTELNLWLSMCARLSIDPGATANVQTLRRIFGGPASATEGALSILRSETVSRAAELGLPGVTAGDVEYARTL